MKTKKMIRTQLYFPKDLYEEAKIYAQNENLTISQIVRAGLILYIQGFKKTKSQKESLDKLIGKYELKDEDNLALKHNQIYDN